MATGRAHEAPRGGEPASGAAFFDLDRTLMAGSSGFFWARAPRGAGMISRRRLARDAWENVKFRLRGSTDESTDRVMARVGAMLEGRRVVDLQRLGPQVLAGVLPRLYPQMLEIAYDHQDAGRPVYIVTAATQDMAEMIAHVLGFDGGLGTPLEEVVDGRYTGRSAGPFTYREGKPMVMRELAEREGIDLSRVLRLLGLGVRPADAARRRPSGRRQPRRARWRASRARRAGTCCASSGSAGG